MKKRLLALLMALTMVFTLAACGGGGTTEAASSGQDGGSGAPASSGQNDAAGEESDDSSDDTQTAGLDGELINFESESGDKLCTIVIPDGWTVQVKGGARVDISNDQGRFTVWVRASASPGYAASMTTQLGSLTIGGVECRWQTSGSGDNVYTEIIEETEGTSALYIFSGDFNLDEPDIVAMLDSITITAKE